MQLLEDFWAFSFELTNSHLFQHSAYLESGLVVAPWPPKRDFGGTPLLTECFSHLPAKLSPLPLYEKVVNTYFH